MNNIYYLVTWVGPASRGGGVLEIWIEVVIYSESIIKFQAWESLLCVWGQADWGVGGHLVTPHCPSDPQPLELCWDSVTGADRTESLTQNSHEVNSTTQSSDRISKQQPDSSCWSQVPQTDRHTIKLQYLHYVTLHCALNFIPKRTWYSKSILLEGFVWKLCDENNINLQLYNFRMIA